MLNETTQWGRSLYRNRDVFIKVNKKGVCDTVSRVWFTWLSETTPWGTQCQHHPLHQSVGGTSLMRTESTLFLEPPAVPPIALPFDWSHQRNYIVLGNEPLLFSLSSFVQRNGDIRCRYVAFIAIVPTDTCPAIAFVLLHNSQYLPLLHSDGPFTGACVTAKRH